MRIIQVTNIISHHQLPLASFLAASVGWHNFRLVATEPSMDERAKMGWNSEDSAPWILRAGENETDRQDFDRWWNDADVAILGNRDIPRMASRLKTGKLTFYMSERWWKPPLGIARLLHPRFAWMAYRFAKLAQRPNFHYLPIGGYAASDIRQIASIQGRILAWGYFTDLPNPLPPCHKRDGVFRILWAGRMLNLKRVDTLLRAYAELLRKASDSRLTLIGQGPCREVLRMLSRKLGIDNSVEFHDSVPAPQVREWMRNAHAYVLPSNGYEGWGAVVNEAMSEGCPIVASEAAGAAKTLIRHGENGLLFTTGDYIQLGALLLQLYSDESLRLRLANAGQQTIADTWSPQVAAERILAFSAAWLAGQPLPSYEVGPLMSI